ncbi:glycosyl hydrolase catalytic core-domain-containing protein [Mycena galericulata]|nr:glycosyl hydrolase catalytic core-domain-containing protein [Mycena galericulata]
MDAETPEHLLGFNEPDIASQANMSPSDAADLWMENIQPWAAKGTKLISPAVAWNLNWTQNFLTELESRDGHVVHWHGDLMLSFGSFTWVKAVDWIGVTGRVNCCMPVGRQLATASEYVLGIDSRSILNSCPFTSRDSCCGTPSETVQMYKNDPPPHRATCPVSALCGTYLFGHFLIVTARTLILASNLICFPRYSRAQFSKSSNLLLAPQIKFVGKFLKYQGSDYMSWFQFTVES